MDTIGIEVYRMQVEQEVYEVKDNWQVVRLYVQRKQTGASQVPPDGSRADRVKEETE